MKRSSDAAGLSSEKDPKRIHTVSSSLLQVLDQQPKHLAPTPAVESSLLQILDHVSFQGEPATACGKTVTQPHNLDRHARSAHQGFTFSCHVEGCGKVYAYLQGLREHTKSAHHGVTFPCHVEGCRKAFTRESSLKRHTDFAHLGFRRQIVTYSCHVEGCVKAFSSRGDLNRHAKSAHLGVTFPCHVEGCAKVFAYQRGLDTHTESAHLGVTFPCHVEGCTKVFAHQCSLDRHTESAHPSPQDAAELQEKKRQLQQILADKQVRGLCTATKTCQNPPVQDSFHCSHHEKVVNIITKTLEERREAGKLSESSIKHPGEFEFLLQRQEVSLDPEVKAELQLLAQGFNNSHPISSRTFTIDAEWIRVVRYLPLDLTIMRANGEVLVSTRVDYGMSIADLEAQCDAEDFVAKRTIRKVYGHATMTWGQTPRQILTTLQDAGVSSDAIF